MERLVEPLNERGYIVFASSCEYKVGELLRNPHIGAGEPIPFPFVVVQETDVCDYLAQALSVRWDTAGWEPSPGSHFYRCTTD